MKWALHPSLDPVAVRLDMLTAVYHPPSGETHLLVDDAFGLLELLRAGEAEQDALAERLGLSVSDTATHLIDLLDAGLVVPA